MAVPVSTPVTTPVKPPTEAINELLLNHDPPNVGSEKSTDVPKQTIPEPEIAPGTG